MALHADIHGFLTALFAHADPGQLVELRWRHGEEMHRRFDTTHRLAVVAAHAERLAARTDVYVGVLPRVRRAGGRDALPERGGVAWVDLDQPDSHDRIAAAVPAPSVLVSTGSAGHVHAYFLLDQPAALAEIEQANRRLAHALGGDPASAEPARILRVPGRHHGHRPPAAVTLEVCAPERRYALDALLAGLPAPPTGTRARTTPTSARDAGEDALLRVAPPVYVRALTGQEVPRSGKVRCPLHDDHRPSLHVYPDPERGWYCYGCRQGGSVYDLAAALSGQSTRGAGFLALRDELTRLLLASRRGQKPPRVRG